MEKSLANKSVVMMVVVALLAGGVGFFGGMKFQQGKSRSSTPGQFAAGQAPSGNMGTGGQRQNGAGAGGGQATGEIVSQDEKSITIKLQDGSSKIVLLSDSTSVTKSTEGSNKDLEVGKTVGVFGTSNSDGSITAQSIELNPTVRGAFTGNGGPKQ